MRNYLGILLFAFSLSGCSSLFYYPSRQLIVPPEKFNLAPEEVFFSAPQGDKLFGWYFKNHAGKKPKAVILFYHGNAENVSSHYLSLIWVLSHGYDFFIFDYAGYGRSEGEPSPANTVRDGQAALDYLHKREPHLPIAVFAQSLGGAIAMRNVIDHKEEYPIKLFFVDSSFPSYRSMARTVMSRHWLTWPIQWLGWLLVSDKYAVRGEIAKIAPVPLVVIHSPDDMVVEEKFGQEIFAEAAEPKEYWANPGGAHIQFMNANENRKKFLQKLDAHFASAKGKP